VKSEASIDGVASVHRPGDSADGADAGTAGADCAAADAAAAVATALTARGGARRRWNG